MTSASLRHGTASLARIIPSERERRHISCRKLFLAPFYCSKPTCTSIFLPTPSPSRLIELLAS